MSEFNVRRLKQGEMTLRRRLKQGEKLYPTVEVTLSPADLDYYRSLGPWAIALDRQSKKAELTREQATGQENRVRNCLTIAREKGVVLPAPRENLERKDGQFHYFFEEDACRYHWFVDGLLGDASGYTASPITRLRLWEAAKTARLLRDHGCGPKYILVGELTRFFRNQLQFLDWYHILKDSGASVCISGCPELTPETEEMLLPTYLSSVAGQSMFLRKSNEMARETFRLRKQLFSTREPFGLQFNLDKKSDGYRREVFPHPIEWPLIREWVDRIYEGEITSKAQAIAWLTAEASMRGIDAARVPTSHTWLTNFLNGETLEGAYRQYKQECQACRVEDDEMKSDWDLSPGGKRRYKVSPTLSESVVFPILLGPGQEIPRAHLLVARQQFRGRPRSSPSPSPQALSIKAGYEASLFRRGVLFCAACGSVVHEVGPRCYGGPVADSHWSAEADRQLLELIHQGLTSQQIADQMGGSLHRINHRRKALKLAGRDYEQERALVEAWWADPFRRRMASWHLYCRCVDAFQASTGRSRDEVKALPETQHQLKRAGSLSLALEPLVWDALRHDPRLEPWATAPRPTHDLATLEGQEQRLSLQVRKIQTAYEADDWTFFTREEAVVRLAELRQDQAQVKAKIAAAKGSLLDDNDRQDALIWHETREMLRRMLDHPRFLESLEFRRKVIELCVRRVTVNLQTGEFVAQTEFRTDALQQLSGRVLLAPSEPSETTPRRGCWRLIQCDLRGHVRLAA